MSLFARHIHESNGHTAIDRAIDEQSPLAKAQEELAHVREVAACLLDYILDRCATCQYNGVYCDRCRVDAILKKAGVRK